MVPQKQPNFAGHSVTLSIPELEQSKTSVLNTLASMHSRRSYDQLTSFSDPETGR